MTISNAVLKRILLLAFLFAAQVLLVWKSEAQVISATAIANGNGCPSGTYAVVFAPDQSSFSVLFSRMNVATKNAQRQDADSKRAKCVVSVDMQLAPGTQISLDRVDYRGFYILEKNAKLAMISEHFFENGATLVRKQNKDMYVAGGTAPGGMRQRLRGPGSESFFWTATKSNQESISPCGGGTRLHVVTSVVLQGGGNSQSQASVDSADGTFSQYYQLNVGPCRHQFNVPATPKDFLKKVLDPNSPQDGIISAI
ncbi:MAG: DUF4360 domain-containing protein [Bdellovibrionota bacterium]